MTPIALTGPIVTQHPKDPDNWIVVREFHHAGLVIPQGFVTDFASIPRAFWSIISPIELGDTGPLVHDYRYRLGLGTRAAADKAFLKDMKADGISWWKRSAAYSLVRAFGWRSWNSGKIVIEELEVVA